MITTAPHADVQAWGPTAHRGVTEILALNCLGCAGWQGTEKRKTQK